MQRIVFIHVTFDLMLVALLLFKSTIEYETFSHAFVLDWLFQVFKCDLHLIN